MQDATAFNPDVAIVRDVSPALARCELTYREREAIDLERAVGEHAGYVRVLRELGLEVVSLPADAAYPDCCFVEDVAIVLDELAVITRPGAESRRGESPVVAQALAAFRQVLPVQPPGTLDGGDVLIVGRKIFVGRTLRTNNAGIESLRAIVSPHGYDVVGVPVKGCLHLKSAVTALDEQTLVANTAWIDSETFRGYEIVPVPPEEPGGANVLSIRGRVLVSAGSHLTRALLERRGSSVIPVRIHEFEKAEAAVTCKSLVFRRRPFASSPARG
jgi:dimethylargininase